MSLCPCGSTKFYNACCAEFIEQRSLPSSPEQLMRSRYTAYARNNMAYIKDTMRGKALLGFDASKVAQSNQQTQWVALTVHHSSLETPDLGYVEFSAQYLEQGIIRTLYETSEFHRIDERWFYVDGVHDSTAKKKQVKPSRNQSCPCGSGRKFKNCHGK